MTTAHRRTTIRRPRTVTASYLPHTVADVYGYPLEHTGAGVTVGIVELGGGFDPNAYPDVDVVAVAVGKGRNKRGVDPDNDAEVQLDIGIVAGVAPDARIRVYFAENTDDGFRAAIDRAVAQCDVVSISWGGPESQWQSSAITRFEEVFADARRLGVPVFVAAGDAGSSDGTGRTTVDYPASSPNVIGCGGTRLLADAASKRLRETTWHDSAASATGGGVSKVFAGRQVPDVAGNADPETGYYVTVNGQGEVLGGTSAVAPLYAALWALIREALGDKRPDVDLLDMIQINPSICFDVTIGNNGAYRAGPGRDRTTGFGVVDGGRLLAVLSDPPPSLTPSPPSQPGPPVPAPPAGAGTLAGAVSALVDAVPADWLAEKHRGGNRTVHDALETFLAAPAVRALS